MSSNLWERMARFLEQEALAYEDLVALGKKKQEALVNGAISELEKVVQAEQLVITRTGKIEENRWKLQEEVATAMNMPPADIKLSDIIDMAGDEFRESMAASRDSIQKSVNQICELNRINSELINQSLSYVEFMLSALASRMKSGYGQDGEVVRRTMGTVDKKA